MLGVVDYGSSSEGSDVEMEDNLQKPAKAGGLNLPPVVAKPKIKKKIFVGEDSELPEKQDWEKKVAEQMQKDKKFVQKTVSEKSKKKIILAFGNDLKAKSADNDSDDEDLPVASHKNRTKFSSELLNLLPQPKNPIKKAAPAQKAASVLLPSSIMNKKPTKRPLEAVPAATRTEAVEGYSDSDNDGESDDFFGLNSKVELPTTSCIAVDEPSAPRARVYIDEVAPGPSLPLPKSIGDYQSIADIEAKLLGQRNISDQEAQALIYNKELAPWGATDRNAREAVLNIVDVSVDEALGPNVRETLLRNLDQKNAVAAPLPVVKAPGERMAKSKHQITHLAKVAVARESQLQQQWADSKAQKRQTRQKYGF
ncbi:unnamed protein product [Bursaphelenchus xylophilus]|uniref:(pine wood nematode) hypothetical protein n=1 Tax=Bursaphelenchus xylophilus TaxID=6326 RepID=A0A1I7RHQ8_BURXY|nr:unnamed protein product [Bursaphelenchus xylophilus]CAG9115483.1 unnamed protein product [Bursaphelenchus xylophilus]